MSHPAYGSLPFGQQINFFRKKLNLPTNTWTDIYTAEHDWAFVVAGANRDDLVADFRSAIAKAIEEGTTLEEFRKDFDKIVHKHGWDYKGERGWRSRVIYETNLTQSYNAGRYQQLKENRAAFPYLRYRHSDAVVHPRKEHLAWDGLILPADDPWWDTHTPANGWGCQCYVEGITEEEALMLGVHQAPPIEYETHIIGKSNPDTARTVRVPKGISPGFEYTPGKARLESEIPPERFTSKSSTGSFGFPNRQATDDLPQARIAGRNSLLADNLTAREYADAFLAEFGASEHQSRIFTDVTGSKLVIGNALFTNRKTGKLKSGDRGRGQYMKLLAASLINPDEIWVRLEHQGARSKNVVRRRYVSRYQTPNEQELLVVFEQGKDGWEGITAHIADTESMINEQRVGVRIYKRED